MLVGPYPRSYGSKGLMRNNIYKICKAYHDLEKGVWAELKDGHRGACSPHSHLLDQDGLQCRYLDNTNQ